MGAVLLLSNSCQHLHINVLVQFVLGYVCLSALATARLGSRCCDDLTENDSVQMSSRASGRPVCLELGSRCCVDLTENDSVQMYASKSAPGGTMSIPALQWSSYDVRSIASARCCSHLQSQLIRRCTCWCFVPALQLCLSTVLFTLAVPALQWSSCVVALAGA